MVEKGSQLSRARPACVCELGAITGATATWHLEHDASLETGLEWRQIR